jgi:glutamate carboxypeptidase
VPRTSARIELLADRPPLARSTRQGAFADCYLAAGKALGLDLEVVATGGASDGNFTGALGVPTIDGLGPVGDGYHTDDEFFREETLTTRTALTAAALRLATESGLRQTAVISEPA